ncbi:MAG TPA: hypothetical protein G4O01_05140 [Dehalococcoidia bacterium]|jgi:hypothetical protein|nr:hypothetical protein [Dehalococcoidia bacterium]
MELARVFDGKKFMWDGRVYTDEKERREMAQKYKDDGFEVEMIEEGGEYFLFTRRVVKEVVVEGAPPI